MTTGPLIPVPAATLHFLCIHIIATQRAVQSAGLISDKRLQYHIDQAEREYDEAMAVQNEQAKQDGDEALRGNPFLTSLRQFAGIEPSSKDEPCPSTSKK